MNIKNILIAVGLSLSLSASAVTDYFKSPKLSFLGTDYNLVWSASTQNGTKIEDFIPEGPSYTQFEKKLSVYYMKNASFEKVFMEKQAEMENGKQEGQILDYKSAVLSKDEIMCNYTSELSQDGVALIVQFSAFRYIRNGKDLIVLEWQHRSYKNASSFKKGIEKHKSKWLDAFSKFDISKFNF